MPFGNRAIIARATPRAFVGNSGQITGHSKIRQIETCHDPLLPRQQANHSGPLMGNPYVGVWPSAVAHHSNRYGAETAPWHRGKAE